MTDMWDRAEAQQDLFYDMLESSDDETIITELKNRGYTVKKKISRISQTQLLLIQFKKIWGLR